jgi:hypothetical protein
MNTRNTSGRSLALLAVTTMVVTACGGGGGSMSPPPPAGNTAPVISGITDKISDQDLVIGPIEFGVGDRESDASLLTVSAATDGGAVVPADGVVLAGSGALRSITLTPLEAATGKVNVMLTVTDPQGVATTRSFGVTVNARNASIRDWSLTTFAKAEGDEVTVMNGFTFAQDADDPAIFEPLIGTGEE